jgi:hypothetical protein
MCVRAEFNWNMYWDVIMRFNSEWAYLMPLVSSCRLRTASVPMRAMQRFVNRVCGAVHRADPQVGCNQQGGCAEHDSMCIMRGLAWSPAQHHSHDTYCLYDSLSQLQLPSPTLRTWAGHL